MCELSVCSTAIGANKGPEICAYILWSQIVAVDAALVGGQLEQAAYDPLVLLVLLDPARHRRTPDRRKPGGAFLLGACGRARDPARGGGGGGERERSLLWVSPLSSFA